MILTVSAALHLLHAGCRLVQSKQKHTSPHWACLAWCALCSFAAAYPFAHVAIELVWHGAHYAPLLLLTHLLIMPLHACMHACTDYEYFPAEALLVLHSSDQTLAASQQRSDYQNSCGFAQAFMRKFKRLILLSFLHTAGSLPFSSSQWGRHHRQLSSAEPCKAQPGHRCGSHNSQGLLL